MAERVKPRSREAVRHFPQGFTRDDGPGDDEWGLLGVCVKRDGSLVVRSRATRLGGASETSHSLDAYQTGSICIRKVSSVAKIWRRNNSLFS
jgi:hypothetical protein